MTGDECPFSHKSSVGQEKDKKKRPQTSKEKQNKTTRIKFSIRQPFFKELHIDKTKIKRMIGSTVTVT
jgi:hypothetical protein